MRILSILVVGLLAACGGSGGENAHPGGGAPGGAAARPRFAFVTNCVAEFWTVATHGVEAARQQLGVDTVVRMPANGTAEEQQRILEDLLAAGVHGIAVSPKDPGNMTALLDKVAGRTLLVTHDSDAPQSRRLAYVGMDNYDAGRLCGKLVQEALPDGGAIVIVVGNLDQDNARRRRQGVIDELLGRDHQPSRFDAQDAKLQAGKYEIRATFTDQFDRQKGKAVAQDALARWSDVACLVGLFEYEPPLLLEAVRSANRLGKVAIVGFDENEATLQGILDGHVHGTVVQNPYDYGRRSIELLARLHAAGGAAPQQALLPKDGFVDIPARAIRSADAAAFRADLLQKTGKAK